MCDFLSIAVSTTCRNRKEKMIECSRAIKEQRLDDSNNFNRYLVDEDSADGT